MNPCVSIIFSLLLLCLKTATANHLVAVAGGRGGGVAKKCLDKERHALLHFKARLEDPDDSLSTWRAEEDDCCSWSGVGCSNRTHHVIAIQIHGVGGRLAGEIGNSLLNLSYLNLLDLSKNSFRGPIPRSVGSLTKLRYLDLGGNGFDGTIPGSISSLTQLRYLDLSDNALYGTIPRSIGSLTELRHLDLSNNSFSGTIPLEFRNLTNLQELFLQSIGRCRVENLEWLSNLSHLQQLSIDGISLAKENHWVDVILSLGKLSYLSLRGCNLSETMYPYSSFVNSSSSVLNLDLRNNNLTSSMYPWLFPLTSNKLRDLDLSNNMLDGIPKYFGDLCSLAGLKLDNNSAVVEFPEFLNNLTGCTCRTLQVLSASHSNFMGSLSDEIHSFSALEELVLPESQLNGTISDKLWELPSLEYLDVSSNYLRGSISKNIGKSKPYLINLSKNSLEGVLSPDHMSNLSYVEFLDLRSCKIGPQFPIWIQSLKNLTSLDLSDTTISDAIPLQFWDMWPSRLSYLNLSSNNITGKAQDLLSNFDDNSVIDLSSNSFYGPILRVPSTLSSLNLSRNKLSGGISFLCQIVDGLLDFLDLSHNFLSGQLPDCLWHFKELKVLNLGHNNLSGRLPPFIGSMLKLEVLYLYGNNLSGELPLSLKNCTSLNSLILGANKFSGNVPDWVGENLLGLYYLILRSNNFSGSIPLQLCQLPNLRVLDLSMNHLDGTVPSCLSNLRSMVQDEFSQVQNVHHYYSLLMYSYSVDAAYFDHAMIEWQGDEREFRNNLKLLKSIDLSSNNLTGQIPYELTDLYGLIALNLSKNALLGEIPTKIGEMKNLLVVDLSRNFLSGEIPSSMSQMPSLGYLDVSSNNLSGRIPSSTQLQSFDSSRYNGNAGLCGPPLTKKCSEDEESGVPSVVGRDVESIVPSVVGRSEGIQRWFYIIGVLVWLLDF